MKEFTLDMLRSGMLIEQRDGCKGIVLLNTSNGDIVKNLPGVKKVIWGPLSTRYNTDLTGHSDRSSGIDIIRVSDSSSNADYFAHYKVIWERSADVSTPKPTTSPKGRYAKKK